MIERVFVSYWENDRHWAEPIGECPACAMKAPHRHLLNEVGCYASLVERVELPVIERMEAESK